MEKLRFPVGMFRAPTPIEVAHVQDWIQTIEAFPKRLADVLSGLAGEKLQWRYRPEGWTVAQVVHHCADSHMNSIIRFKLALTENRPTIRPYAEDRWAELADSSAPECADSLRLLEGVHARWVTLLRSLTAQDLAREFVHPESQAAIRLDENIGIYAWHCDHHFAHVEQALASGGCYNG